MRGFLLLLVLAPAAAVAAGYPVEAVLVGIVGREGGSALMHLAVFALVGFALAAGRPGAEPGGDLVRLALLAGGFELAQGWTDILAGDDLVDLALDLAGAGAGLLAAHLPRGRPAPDGSADPTTGV